MVIFFKLKTWKKRRPLRLEGCKQLALMCTTEIFPLLMQITHTCIYKSVLFFPLKSHFVACFTCPTVLPKIFNQTIAI